MPAGFGGGKFGGSVYRKKQRDKLIFLFASGLALSFFVLLVVVFVSKSATASKSGQPSNLAVAPISGTVTLFTSERSIPAGTKISAAALKNIYWPRDSMPEGAITESSILEGSVAKVDIPAGEPITNVQLSLKSSHSEVLEVSSGMRAVTIEVESKRGMEAWVKPGIHVDVVITYTEGSELVSKIAVENARILSSGNEGSGVSAPSASSGRYQAQSASTMTLEVLPKDALKLETAAELGKLSLHLRSKDDSGAAGIESFGSREFEDPDVKKQKQAAASPAVPSCQKGKMKIEGKEYIVDCNGGLVPVN